RRADALDRAVPESDVHHGGAPVGRKEPRAVVAAPCASGDEPCERQHRTSPGHRLASPTAAARPAAPRRLAARTTRITASPPRAARGAEPPRPPLGSHYHTAASWRERRCQGASGKVIGRIAGSVTPASRYAATYARPAAESPTAASAPASVAGTSPSRSKART